MSGKEPLKLTARALHWVFKIGDREESIKFFRDTLGMKVLRHEEFSEGCKATCNGPYNGKWSKTMIGYGAEDDHFVAELTYNYGVGTYKLGNDFAGITIRSSKAAAAVKSSGLKHEVKDKVVETSAPDGYPFKIVDEDAVGDPVQSVEIGVSDLEKSLKFWRDLLGMKMDSSTDSSASLTFGAGQCSLLLRKVDQVAHETAFGRVAFAVPADQLQGIQDRVKEDKLGSVVTELVKLDTPGKATVQVVILGDPDGHEICFVGDEGFRDLSKVDPEGDNLLKKAMEDDKSKEWFAKKGLQKEAA